VVSGSCVHSRPRALSQQTDISTYSFQLNGSATTVSVRVYFRRLFEPIAESYGWDLGEVLMEERVVTVD
jgi:hypothetical protein